MLAVKVFKKTFWKQNKTKQNKAKQLWIRFYSKRENLREKLKIQWGQKYLAALEQ